MYFDRTGRQVHKMHCGRGTTPNGCLQTTTPDVAVNAKLNYDNTMCSSQRYGNTDMVPVNNAYEISFQSLHAKVLCPTKT